MLDSATVPVLERLEQVLATSDALLQSFKRLESERLRNSRVRDLLEKKTAFESKRSLDRLTPEEETLIADKSYESYIDESKRIVKERDRTAERSRPDFVRKVQSLLPDLEIDYPTTRGFGQAFERLLEELPEDSEEPGLVMRFQLKLDTLLRDARDKAYGEGASLRSIQVDPPTKEPRHSAGVVDLSEPISVTQSDGTESNIGQPRKRSRGPDYDKSQRRMDLLGALVGELTTIHQQLNKCRSIEKLREKYPKFQLWIRLPESEHKDLLGDFKPKTYAETLVLRAEGLTSKESLKADRKKLRNRPLQP